MKQSSLFGVNAKDIVKGFITAFITAFLTAAMQLLQDGKIPTTKELSTAGIVGLTAGIAYILKNYLTNSKDEFLKKEG